VGTKGNEIIKVKRYGESQNARARKRERIRRERGDPVGVRELSDSLIYFNYRGSLEGEKRGRQEKGERKKNIRGGLPWPVILTRKRPWGGGRGRNQPPNFSRARERKVWIRFGEIDEIVNGRD